jgi:uncharacterized Zn-binding protein involved in type VI secretion
MGSTIQLRVVVLLAASLAGPHAGLAQTAADPGVPAVITQGSGTVSVGGQAAARQGDATDRAGSLVQGSSNVMIGGRPAATVGDRTGCGGMTIGGASNVFINGKPMARAGDLTTGCTEK